MNCACVAEVLALLEEAELSRAAAGGVARIARYRTARRLRERLARLGRIDGLSRFAREHFRALLEPFILWTPYWAIQAGGMAAAIGPGGAALADGHGRDRGALFMASHAFEHPDDPFPEFAEERPVARRRRALRIR